MLSTSPNAFAKVWRLSWPIILSNITVPLLGLVDTAVVGHLSDARYLAAVTLGATLFSFLFWGFGFLRMGTTGLTSQAVGREDSSAVRHLIGQSLLMALGIGLALIAFSTPLIEFGLWLLQGSSDTQALAASYAHIRILSAPAVLANYAIIGWFLGQQNSRVTLLLMVTSNTINIVLDLWFVLGFGLKSDGVATATVIADYSACTLGLLLVARQLASVGGHWQPERLFRWRAYGELFRVNHHLFVRTLCLLFAMAFFTAQGARMDTVTLAANAVLMQLVMMTSYGLDGFANAAEALTGKAVGANDWQAFGRDVRACTLFSLLTAVTASLAFLGFGNELIGLLTDIDEVRGYAATYLPWVVVLPIVAVWSYLLDGIFIGAIQTRAMRDTMVMSLAIYLLCWLMTRPLDNAGLWLSFTMFMLVRSASLGLVYQRKRRTQWCRSSSSS
ncbi:MATE family efflux transporter [Larsenimonas salina]|uniref:MATE family efflux transporter n=1 Tax=Larsenimonas salina TaxID=1295565 RepID=UPI002073B136|nr:MATE family efflux transporter [Larsenimonas salina]MCM5705026.1 MATE family efflux transporter [Larsenimonas salina]